jgi:hypothetical protein
LKQIVHGSPGVVCHVGSVRLHETHTLPDGSRVRLRLPHIADRDALHELLAEHGLTADELEIRRALRWSPDRPVVVAVEWQGSVERLVGFAAGDTVIAPRHVAPLLREYEGRRVA